MAGWEGYGVVDVSDTLALTRGPREITISCDREIGMRAWTVRVNGRFIWDSWREAPARRLAMNLHQALAVAAEEQGDE